MATWTQKQTVSVASPIAANIAVSDGTLLYYPSNNEIQKYTPGTDTVDQISNFADPLSHAAGVFPLALFAGNLYAITQGAAIPNTHIYKYTGSGTTWTGMHDFSPTPYGGSLYPFVSLHVNDSHLLAISLANNANGNLYSLDGTNWNGITWSDSPPQQNFTASYDATRLTYSPEWANFTLVDSSTDTPTFQVDTYRYFQFNEATDNMDIIASLVGTPPVGDAWVLELLSGLQDELRFWKPDSGSPPYRWTTSPTGVWTLPSESASGDIIPVRAWGMAQSCGYRYDATNLYFHLLSSDGSSWDDGELIGSWVSAASLNFVVRTTSDNFVYLFAKNGNTVTLWARDEALPDPTPPVADVNRLWVYKTANRGIDWTSRGIQS